MQYLAFDAAEALLEGRDFTKRYYYIAHLLDRILLGREKDDKYDELRQAFRGGQVLELHLFNEEKEIFATMAEGRYLVYDPLFHELTDEEGRVITRRYKLMPEMQDNKEFSYNQLEVKEYVAKDEKAHAAHEDHMAYIEKTVLYRFARGEER